MRLIITLLSAVFLAGCAQHYTSSTDESYGFFYGIWHGIISPFAIIANIFSWLLSLIGIDFLSAIQIVGQPNTGLFYYVGFLFGIGSIAGSSRQ